MTAEEFLLLLINNIILYIFCFIIVLIPYVILLKRYKIFVFDPLFYGFIMSVFANTVPVFLFFLHKINFFVFSNFILTQLSFFIGFLIFKPIKIKNIQICKRSNYRSAIYPQILFLSISIFFLINQFAIYYIKGIPLFMESRLDLFSDGGGLGILNRFVQVSSILTLFLGFTLIFEYNLKIYFRLLIYFMFFAYSITCILSGSKGQFLTFGFVLFIYLFYSSRYASKNLRYLNTLRKYIVYVLVFAIVIFYISFFFKYSKFNFGFATIDIAQRFIINGDVFWNAYPNNVYLKVNNSNPMLDIFKSFLTTTRIVSWEDIPLSIGRQLYKILYPDISANFGPNARHNVMGLIYFGFIGSLIFSFILGLILGYSRNKLFFQLKRNYFGGLIYCLIYLTVISIEGDLSYTIDNFVNIIITLLFVFLLFLLFYFIYNYTILIRNILKNNDKKDHY